jgi:hypothetical protein
MTRKETDAIKLKPGYWWENVAPLGEAPNWEMRPMPTPQREDTIFGYDAAAFMARQYK